MCYSLFRGLAQILLQTDYKCEPPTPITGMYQVVLNF